MLKEWGIASGSVNANVNVNETVGGGVMVVRRQQVSSRAYRQAHNSERADVQTAIRGWGGHMAW